MTHCAGVYQRIDPSSELHALAGLQAGVITREQAVGSGLGPRSQRRLLDQQHWQRLASGVLLTHAHTADWRALAWAGVLRGGEHARLGGLAAAYLHQLVDQPPERLLVLIPHERRRSQEKPWTFRRERAGVRRPLSVGSPPRTTIEDTVLDLCGGGIPDGGRSSLAWVTDAVQRRLTTVERLRHALRQRPRLSGRPVLAEILEDVGEGAESVLEHRYLHRVERAHQLPQGVRQVHAQGRRGSNYRDVRYREYRLLVELDGEVGHVGMDRFRDFRRDNEALLNGEMTLRYGRQDVFGEACAVARQVAEMLVRGGWQGRFRPCPSCQSTEG